MTDILDRAWIGWREWVRAVTTFGGAAPAVQVQKSAGKRPTATYLKPDLKHANRVKLKRDLDLHRRPRVKGEKTVEMKQLRRTKVEITDPKKPPKTVEEKLLRKVDPVRPFDIDEQYLETPAEREDRVMKAEKKKVPARFTRPPLSKLRRHLLFLNPGTQKVKEAHQGFVSGGKLPNWTRYLLTGLTYDAKNLYFENLPVVTAETKRFAVKDLYFNPKEGSTIQPITDRLRDQYANISKSNVTKILRSIETYQINFRRRLPPKVLSRMSMTQPGVILTDMFFPSVKHGWRKFGGCVTMMDAWSRFVGVYAVERKTKALVKKAMTRFMRDFASHGHLPKMVLMDQGSDLVAAKEVIETYRTKAGAKMVFYSKVGKPVQLVEQTQAQIQRRMAVFRTAGLTTDASAILEDISTSINNQKRPDRGNLTPIQLLKLTKSERLQINAMYRDKNEVPEIKGLRALFQGSRVRVLLMTFKEQVQNKTKGFAPKWSRDIYTVKKKTALQGNPNNFRYFLYGEKESYFRHELLWIPRNVDQEVVGRHVEGRREKLIVEQAEGIPDSDSDGFEPDYPSDDSRYEDRDDEKRSQV